jgi:hypothetical protein
MAARRLPTICARVAVVAVIAAGARAHAQPAPAAASPAADAPNIAGDEHMAWNVGVDPDTRAAARAIFLEGNRLFKIPLFSQAVEKYGEALARWRHPAFSFNLALTLINLGRYLEARDQLVRAIAYGPAPLRADRFAEAQKQLVEVERHLGRLHVRCAVAGAEVALDGAKLFTGPGERTLWVVPQDHDLAAKKSAYRTQDAHVHVAAGAMETVELAPHPLIEDRPWAVWKPWAVVGAGVAIAGGGGALHALSARGFSAFDAGFAALPCAAMGCSGDQIAAGNPGLPGRLDRARLEQRLAVGAYLVGGAALATGIYLVYRNQPHVVEQEGPEPPARGVAVAPVVAPDLIGVLVSVRR